MIDEEKLSVALHNLAEPDETGPAPINGLLQRGRRARLIRFARTAGITMAAVAVAAGLAAVARPRESGPVPLALAAQTTQRATFQFEQTFSLKGPTGEAIIPAGTPYRGAYDPVHDRGYRIQVMPGEPHLTTEERQIGDDCYSRHSPRDPWYLSSMSGERWSGCWRLTDSAEGSVLGISASPGDLLVELENAGQVSYAGRTDKGRHGVDTYRFTYRYAVDAGPDDHRVLEKHGTVDIEVATRRVIRLAYGSTDVTGDRDGRYLLAFSQELTLFGFGEPVVVKKPANIATR
jgi:hypothetical protein